MYHRILAFLTILALSLLSSQTLAQDLDSLITEANKRAQLYDTSSSRVQKCLNAVLKEADPRTLLIPDYFFNDPVPIKPYLNRNRYMPENSASDLYPFLVLGSYFTSPELLDTRMTEMLRNDVRFTTKNTGIPSDYWLKRQLKTHSSMFGAGEYAKDGLIAITERMGRNAWYWRMHDMIVDLMENAHIDSDFGQLPSTDTELNGDLLQVLPRLYHMSGDKRFLDWARRIGDAYVYEVLPRNHYLPANWNFHKHTGRRQVYLRDHGNETIVGLSMLLATEKFLESSRVKPYEEVLGKMFDRIIASANPDGLLFNQIDAETLEPINAGLADNWGYVYGAVYNFYLVTKVEKYREAVLKTLRNVTKYVNYGWEGRHYDGYADSIEGAIYLLNREPIPETFTWVDTEIEHMFSQQKADGHLDGMYLEGNFIRTTLLHLAMKSQGISVSNWHPGVGVGAVPYGKGLLFNISVTPAASMKWDGFIRFDYARHKRILNYPVNIFRLNESPEWFVVDENSLYAITRLDGSATEIYLGSELIGGKSFKAGSWVIQPARTIAGEEEFSKKQQKK